MSKLNKNMFVFLFCFLFIGIGFCSQDLIAKTGDSLLGFINSNSSISYRIDKLQRKIEETYTNDLLYHEHMLNINSLKENLLGTKVVFKDDTTIVKSDSGKLTDPRSKLNANEIHAVVSSIKKLYTVVENNDSNFLYCFAPTKELYEKPPSNIVYYDIENCERFLNQMKSSNIPYINFKDLLSEKGIPDSDVFYITDHHWTSYTGFVATEIICEELNNRYGFEYNREYCDINNYNVVNYQEWFLGSRGKKVGLYFTEHGADNFDLITPKFNTDMTEEQPFKGIVRKGIFEDSVLFMENLKKDYYGISTYTTYGGGDFRLEIIKNNLNPNGKKILLIRDSFACVVSPFLSLQTSEIHICDMRNFTGSIGDKVNVEEYIKKINPDYVLVLYSGISDYTITKGYYDFF